MLTHRIIIDCDPGHDDMAAILLAAWHPSIQIEAITSVCLSLIHISEPTRPY